MLGTRVGLADFMPSNNMLAMQLWPQGLKRDGITPITYNWGYIYILYTYIIIVPFDYPKSQMKDLRLNCLVHYCNLWVSHPFFTDLAISAHSSTDTLWSICEYGIYGSITQVNTNIAICIQELIINNEILECFMASFSKENLAISARSAVELAVLS